MSRIHSELASVPAPHPAEGTNRPAALTEAYDGRFDTFEDDDDVELAPPPPPLPPRRAPLRLVERLDQEKTSTSEPDRSARFGSEDDLEFASFRAAEVEHRPALRYYAVSNALPLSALPQALSRLMLPRILSIAPTASAGPRQSLAMPLPAIDADPIEPASRLLALMREQRSLLERLADQSQPSPPAPDIPPPDVPALGLLPFSPAFFDVRDIPSDYDLDRGEMQPEPFNGYDFSCPGPADEAASSLMPIDTAWDPEDGSEDVQQRHSAEDIIRALAAIEPAQDPESRESLSELAYARTRAAEAEMWSGRPASPDARFSVMSYETERPPMIIERAQAELDNLAAFGPSRPPAMPNPLPGFLIGLGMSACTGWGVFFALRLY